VAESPEVLNKDPHGTWLIRIKLTAPEQVAGLLTATDYQKYADAE